MAEHHSPEEWGSIVAAITAVVAHDFPRASAEFQEMIVAEIVMAASDPRSPLHRAFVEWDDSRVAELHREQDAYRRRN